MAEHPIQGLMNSAMENLKSMVDVNTIIGDPVHTPDGSVIITVSKVGFGFAAGGSEFNGQSGKKEDKETKHPFGGGSGGGVSITPMAFLVVNANGIKMLHLDEKTSLVEKMFDAAPVAFDKVNSLVTKMSNKKNETQPTYYPDEEILD